MNARTRPVFLPVRGADDPQVLRALAGPPQGLRPLHLTSRRIYPRALCGARVTDPFEPYRQDTAGRDRCTDCLRVLRDRRQGRSG
jgi:hypothetical protein